MRDIVDETPEWETVRNEDTVPDTIRICGVSYTAEELGEAIATVGVAKNTDVLLPHVWARFAKILCAEVARLKEEAAIRDTKTACAYCGQEYPLDDKAATAVSEHIRTCEKHPLFDTMREVRRLEAANARLQRVVEAGKSKTAEWQAEALACSPVNTYAVGICSSIHAALSETKEETREDGDDGPETQIAVDRLESDDNL